MKLVRFNHVDEPPTAARLGVMIGDDLIADVRVAAARFFSEVKRDPMAQKLADIRFPGYVADLLRSGSPSLNELRDICDWLSSLAATDGLKASHDGRPLFLPANRSRLHVSVRPGKLLVIGGSYGHQSKDGPSCWLKATTSSIGPVRPIEMPRSADVLVGRAELGIAIGKKCRNVTAANALDFVAGYTVICNSVVRRAGQVQSHRSFTEFTSDATTPIGPWLITRDDVPDIDAVELMTTVNGQKKLSKRLSGLGWGVADVVAFASQVTLEPGDLISIGGTDLFSPQYEAVELKVGDEIECEISEIGKTKNRVISEPNEARA